MDILYGLLIAFHILVSAMLVLMILLQPGKGGGGMGAVFGGGSSTSVFGGRGATTILSKGTGILAALFFVLSIAIAMTSTEKSVTAGAEDVAPISAPAETAE